MFNLNVEPLCESNLQEQLEMLGGIVMQQPSMLQYSLLGHHFALCWLEPPGDWKIGYNIVQTRRWSCAHCISNCRWMMPTVVRCLRALSIAGLLRSSRHLTATEPPQTGWNMTVF